MISSLNSLTGKTYMSIQKVERTVSEASGADFDSVLNKASTKTYSENELDNIFKQASETYDISYDLLKAVAKAESDFDADCVSSSGAVGVMQLMPETAKELGVTNSYDAEQNIMGGAKYLSQKLEEYDQDISLALAAYNAGSGNVNKYGGIPPFQETQNYVTKILGYLENGY